MITWSLPIKLSSEANSREYWAKKHKRHKEQKTRVKIAFLEHRPEITLPVKITLTRISPRKYDPDNLQTAFKYIRDAIAENIFPGTKAGMADNHPQLSWEYKQETGFPKEYRIVIKFD